MKLTKEQIRNIIEAAIMMAETPLPLANIVDLFNPEDEVEKQEIIAGVNELEEVYRERGINLKSSPLGYKFQTAPQYAPWLIKLTAKSVIKYSKAFWETLAIIVYRQPITRAEIEEIRGVTISQNIMRLLLEHNWVKIVGHKELPGRPALYASTRQFLADFNLDGLQDLPPIDLLAEKIEGVDLGNNPLLRPNQNIEEVVL